MSAIRLAALLVSFMLAGCASTNQNPKDPFEPFNRGVYQLNDAVDRAVVKPAAKSYNMIMPPPGRMMVSSFFSNLCDINVAINDLLQLKVVQAASDSGRILVNSTIGIFGLVDVASQVGLEKHNEDFGQTLGYWGVGSGPYLMVPLFGPSSIRDSVGLYADSLSGALKKIKQVDTRNRSYATNLLSQRAGLLDQEKILDEAVIDRYSFIRDAYMQRRRSLIYDGSPPREKFDDDEGGNVPDKTSVNSNNKDMRSTVPDATTIVAPNPAINTGSFGPQQDGVYHIWLSQHGGIH